MTKPPLADVPVRTADELTARWHALLGEPVFGARALWLTWLDDGLMVPVVIPVDGVPAVPDRPMLANLADMCEQVAAAHGLLLGHVAMALCRPGRPSATRDDDAWATALREAFAGSDLTWSLHLAAGGAIVPLVDLPG
ncbi:hypothetical protein [Blastococcus sp. TF02A-30]|uniref:hypothetical protein n=1 Tax=Blastococcus sp. TF02A-30 TaxID=2250580 RepID=UPI000DEAC1CC|nr:hypothetical protein [Blastococcus sp. TF02A-30]RBY91031.1 hypothetical protein DQ241_04950 [Blastococcus sp. TF02A-30]